MSLINDALNRAQAEAANKEALARGEVPIADLGPDLPRKRRLPGWVRWSAVLAVAVLIAVLSWRAPSTVESELMAEAPVAAAVQPMPTQQPPPLTQDRAAPAEAPASPQPEVRDDPPETRGASVAQPAAPRPTVREVAVSAPSSDAAAEDRLTTAADAGSVELEEFEPLAEIRAGLQEERQTGGVEAGPTPAAPANRPTTVWPADGAEPETWYFVGKVELEGGGEIELGGIAWSESAPAAMLNGSLLKVGGEILGLQVVSIAPRTVTLAGQGQRIALQLASARD